MGFTKPESFARQISVYLKERRDDRAYATSRDFVKAFPGELMPHVLLAESCFRMGRFPEAKIEGKKALALASSDSDIVFCSMVFSSACFQMKDYLEGYETLKRTLNGRFIPEVEEALLLFSFAMKDEPKAVVHMKNLIVLNRGRAIQVMDAYADGLKSAQ